MAPKFRVVVLVLSMAVAVSLFAAGEAAAQRHGGPGGGHPGGPGGPGRAVAAPSHVYYPARPYYAPHYYYSPFFYAPYYYYNPFFWGGWGGGYGYRFGVGFGYGYGGGYWQYPYYYGGSYDMTGAARLQVSPKQAQVFVDGYYVGLADEFDGTMQRLRVDAGQHEVELYLEGYRTVRTPILFRRDGTVTIRTAMEPLAAGETSERPTPLAPRPGDPYDPNAPQPPAAARAYQGERMPPPPAPGGRDSYGTLAIRVQPGDAEILIDGQHWDGSDNGSRLTVQLADGPHRVEVRREGYRPYTANVRITRGQTESLNISLTQ